MKVLVYWKGEAAESQGHRTVFYGVEWVCEERERLILACTDDPERPPRYVLSYDDVAYWHETNPEVTD